MTVSHEEFTSTGSTAGVQAKVVDKPLEILGCVDVIPVRQQCDLEPARLGACLRLGTDRRAIKVLPLKKGWL